MALRYGLIRETQIHVPRNAGIYEIDVSRTNVDSIPFNQFSLSKCSLRAEIQLLENVYLSKLRQDFYSVAAALESGPRAQGWRWHRRWCSSPINRKPGRRGAAVACGALESLTHPSLTLSYGHSVVLLCSRYLILLARYSTVDFPNNNVNFCSPSSTLTRKGRFECKPLD